MDFKSILTSFSTPERALALWEKLRTGGVLGTTADTACAGDDARLTPGAVAQDTSLGRDATGGWVQRTAAQFKSWIQLTKSDVGLGNVDNTEDSKKPGIVHVLVATGITSAGEIGITIPANSLILAVFARNTTGTAQTTGWSLKLGAYNSTNYLTVGGGGAALISMTGDQAWAAAALSNNAYSTTATGGSSSVVSVSVVASGASMDFKIAYITP